MAKPQNIIGIGSYCILDRPVFEWSQVLLHPELTPWWSFLFAYGAHHKKPHSPTHPKFAIWFPHFRYNSKQLLNGHQNGVETAGHNTLPEV